MPVWEREKAFLLWFMTLETACVSRSRSAAFATSFLQLDSVSSVRTTLLDRFCVMTETPPEDAGLHSNKVHHPRGIGIFLLIAFRVTGQALMFCVALARSCTGDVYHDFGSLSVIKWASSVGGIVMPTYSGVKAGVPCPFPLAAMVQSCPVDIGSFWCVVLGIRCPHCGIKSRGNRSLTSLGIILRFFT